jgi:hypothetical protein
MRSGAVLIKAGLFLLSSAVCLLGALSARAEEPDPRKLKPTYGMFNAGFHVEAGAGVYQVVGQGGFVPGIYPRVALEYHLGPHFSIAAVGRLQTSVDQGVPDFAQLSVAPGLNLRLRELEWPFAIVFGAAVRIGKFSASQELVDANFQATPDSGTEEALGFPLAPEATAKFEWWVASPLAIKASVTYCPIFVGATTIHNIEEAVAVALVF